jgi:hypothetical protein
MGRLILFVAQLVVCWFAGQALVRWIRIDTGDLQYFLYAVIFAALAWICGLVGAEVLQGVERPSPRTLLWSLIVGLIGAGLLFVPQVRGMLPSMPVLVLPLIGAVLGYHLRK